MRFSASLGTFRTFLNSMPRIFCPLLWLPYSAVVARANSWHQQLGSSPWAAYNNTLSLFSLLRREKGVRARSASTTGGGAPITSRLTPTPTPNHHRRTVFTHHPKHEQQMLQTLTQVWHAAQARQAPMIYPCSVLYAPSLGALSRSVLTFSLAHSRGPPALSHNSLDCQFQRPILVVGSGCTTTPTDLVFCRDSKQNRLKADRRWDSKQMKSEAKAAQSSIDHHAQNILGGSVCISPEIGSYPYHKSQRG